MALLEFMFVLPLFLFLALFSIDMGRAMLTYGALSDSAYVAARAGAQAGSTAPRYGDSRVVFVDSLKKVPGIDTTRRAELTVVNGTCTTSRRYIELNASMPFDFITPGLGQVLTLFTKSSNTIGRTWTMTARAVVLCEVAR